MIGAQSTDQYTPPTDEGNPEYWRAGCECARAGLCYRCRAAAEIERLIRTRNRDHEQAWMNGAAALQARHERDCAVQELAGTRAIVHLAKRLDAVLCEFGTEPAYIAEAAQALHDVLNGNGGFYQVCNVCGGVPVPGTGRCKSHTDDVSAPFVCANCDGTGWFSEEEKEPCDECADGEQHYLKLTGHLPGCGVYEGTQRGPCSCSQSTRS